ncbi:MAG TPA: Ger(x)C family spore germination protein [Bacillota bacterium]|nr:Ger(x)C family spore germination protein [Bacillota bacterium]
MLLGVFFLLSFPGCWDVRDVNNIAFAMAMGIDLPSDPGSARYKITLEFAEPVAGGPMPKSLVMTEEASSILQGIQKIQTQTSRTISFSHLRVLLVGERMAKQRDFEDLVNYLMKDPQVALRLRLLFVQRDEAQACFRAKLKFNELLAAKLVAMGELDRELSLMRTNNFFDFWRDLKDSNGVALGSRAFLRGKALFIEGAAVYKNRKLIAWLTNEEAQAANWLVERTQAVVVARDGENGYTYQVRKYRTRIKPILQEGKITFLVKVKTDGRIMEESGDNLDFSKAENLKKVKIMFSNAIKGQVESAIAKSQHELKLDYLGFGKELKRHRPETFKALHWNRLFPKVPVKVKVDCKVSSSGLQT